MTALMSKRASERVRVGTFWNSPSLRSAVASSSPVGFSRVRDEEAGAAIILNFRMEIWGFVKSGFEWKLEMFFVGDT